MNLMELFIPVTVQDEGVTKGISKIKSGIGTVAKVGAAAVAAGAAAVAGATTAFVAATGNVAAYGDSIDKMSQKMNMSAEAYQEWDAIMQHSGTSIDAMQRGLVTLSTAAEKGKDAFEKIGIAQSELESLNQEELFSRVITGLQGMEEGTERTALAQQLLGGAAKELGPLLNTSAEDTEAMRQRLHELGGVMSDEAIKSAAAYQDSLQDMQTAFSGVKRNLLAEFMPAITDVMDGITDLFSGAPESGTGKISAGLDKLVSTVSETIPKIFEKGEQLVQSLLQAIIKNLPELIKSGVTIVLKLAVGIIKAIPDLVKQIPAVIAAIIGAIVEAWPDIKEAGIELIHELGNGLIAAKEFLGGKVHELITAIQEWFANLPDKMANLGSDLVRGLWNGISNMAAWIRDKIKGFGDSVLNSLKNFFGIKSPSRVMRDQVGKMLGLGIAEGIEDETGAAVKAAQDMAAGILGASSVNGAFAGSTISAGGYSANPAQMMWNPGTNQPIIVNVTTTLDGKILSRQTYQYNQTEQSRRGASLVNP